MQFYRNQCFKLLFAVLAVLFISVTSAHAGKAPTEENVANVNGTMISKKDFDREIQIVLQRYSMKGHPLSDSQLAQVRKSVLEKLIESEVLYQESLKAGIKIDDKLVEDEVQKLKKRVPSEEEFKKFLDNFHLTEADLKTQFQRTMAIRKLIEEKVVKDITVTDKETKDYFDKNQASFKQPEEVRASHILIKVASDADQAAKDKARKKIADIQKELKKGADFAELAKKYSEGPSATRGGDLGYFKRGQMVKPFEDAAFGMKAGEVSDVVETRFGYHLIKVSDKKDAKTMSYEEMKDKIAGFLKQKKSQEAVSGYVEGLKGKIKIQQFPLKEK